MKLVSVLVLTTILNFGNAFAGDHNPVSIIGLLGTAKMTLLEAVDYAEKTSGVATSAKYEVEDGKLMMSVYTVPEGLNVEAENATLTELSGEASEDLGKLGKEVFADKEHIARASVHLTLFQMSKLSLKNVILKAQEYANGVAVDVRNPIVKNRRPVADVVVVNNKKEATTVSIDLLSGQVLCD